MKIESLEGIVLSETGARSIYEWLGNQIQELDNRRAIQNSNTSEGIKDE